MRLPSGKNVNEFNGVFEEGFLQGLAKVLSNFLQDC